MLGRPIVLVVISTNLHLLEFLDDRLLGGTRLNYDLTASHAPSNFFTHGSSRYGSGLCIVVSLRLQTLTLSLWQLFVSGLTLEALIR